MVLLVDDDAEVVMNAWRALEAATACVPKDSLPSLVRVTAWVWGRGVLRGDIVICCDLI